MIIPGEEIAAIPSIIVFTGNKVTEATTATVIPTVSKSWHKQRDQRDQFYIKLTPYTNIIYHMLPKNN